MRFKSYFLLCVLCLIAIKSSAQWREQFIAKKNQSPIYGLHPVDDREAWFVAGAGVRDIEKRFYKTDWGGEYFWSGLIANLTTNYEPTTMSVFNGQVATIGYSGRGFTSQPSIVLRTTNGGATWRNITPAPFAPSVFVSVNHFFDYSNGLVFADDNTNKRFVCYVTGANGAYWSQVWNGAMVARQNGEFTRTLRETYGDNVWIYAVNLVNKTWRILHTSNKGYTWEASKSLPDDRFTPNDFAFCNGTEGVLLPLDYSTSKPIFRTQDGGLNWEPVKEDASVGKYVKQMVCHVKGTKRTFAASFIRNDSLFTAFTSDFGRNWYGWELVQYEKDQLSKDIAFASTSSGWVLGGTGATRVFKWKGDITAYPEFQINESDNSELNLKMPRLQEKTPMTIKVFPNPAKDVLNIETSTNDATQLVTIMDIYGRRLKSTTLSTSTTLNWDISDLDAGNYILEVKTAKDIKTQKVMIYK